MDSADHSAGQHEAGVGDTGPIAASPLPLRMPLACPAAAEEVAAADEAAAPAPLFRLFVGYVPRTYTEADLKPLFDQWGDVRDILILKDKASGEPRGCAFVSYATRDEAEAAVRHLDRRVRLPGAPNALEVRVARSHLYVQAGSGPENNRQLFFTRAPPTASEADVRAAFAAHGPVEEVSLFKERRRQVSKGCGFVLMATRQAAVDAIAALDGKLVMAGADRPLCVSWADPNLQERKRRAVEESTSDNRMVFVAKVDRGASEEDVRALMAQHGQVCEVNLFRAFQGAPNTKGCGLVTMATASDAAAAIDALDGRYTWDGVDSPMVVKWMDAALQRRRRDEYLSSSTRPGPSSGSSVPGTPSASSSGAFASGGSMGPLAAAGALGATTAAARRGAAAAASSSSVGGALAPWASAVSRLTTLGSFDLRPPSRQGPDAYAFASAPGLPPPLPSYAAAPQRPPSSSGGRLSGGAQPQSPLLPPPSRGGYQPPAGDSLQQTAAHVQQAAAMPQQQLLPPGSAGTMGYTSVYHQLGGVSFNQARPQGDYGLQQQQQYLQQFQQQQQQQQQQQYPQQQQFHQQYHHHQQQQPLGMYVSMAPDGTLYTMPALMATTATRSTSGGTTMPAGTEFLVPAGGQMLPAGPSDPPASGSISSGSVLGAAAQQYGSSYGPGSSSIGGAGMVAGASMAPFGHQGMDALNSSSQPGSGGGGGLQVTLKLPLVTSGQLVMLTGHAYSIQSATGAEIITQPVAPGVFDLYLRGGQAQVEAAQRLINALLQAQAPALQ